MRGLIICCLLLFAAGCIDEVAKTDTTIVKATTTSSVKVRTTIIGEISDIVCEDITNATEKDQCIFNRARTNKYRKDCNLIEWDNLKFRCFAAVEKNPRHCEKIDVYYEKDKCMWDMAFGLNNRSYCKEISQMGLREKCIYNYITYKKPDPLECIDLTNVTLRDKCIFDHIGKRAFNDKPYIAPDLCHLIVDGELELKCNQTYLGK